MLDLPIPPVPWFQDPDEFAELLDLFREVAPRRVLEVGSFYGGTLWQWINNMQPGAVIVSVDLLVPDNDRRRWEVLQARGLWQGWAEKAKVELTVIDGDSTDREIVKTVRGLKPFDFIFVDGGHEYKTVSKDFRNYFPLLSPSGCMAFHDIGHMAERVEVDRFWHELVATRQYTTGEINILPGTWGIGVIRT